MKEIHKFLVETSGGCLTCFDKYSSAVHYYEGDCQAYAILTLSAGGSLAALRGHSIHI